MTNRRPLPLGPVPLDERTSRALDETLADWRYEAAHAESRRARLAAAVQGTGGIAAVFIRAAIDDLTHWPAWRGALSALMLAAILGLISASFWAVSLVPADYPAPASEVAKLATLLMPTAISICLPLALLARPLAAMGVAPAKGVLGGCALLALFAAFNVGWLSPVSNQVYRGAAFSAYWPNDPAPDEYDIWPPRGPAELTALELTDAIRFDALNVVRLWRQLHTRLALIAFVPVSLLLGIQIRRLLIQRGWRRQLAATALLVGFGIWLGATLLLRAILIQAAFSIAPPVTLIADGPLIAGAWLAPVAFAIVALALACFDRQQATDAQTRAGGSSCSL